MYPVSNAYKAAILKNARAHKLKGYVDGVAFDGNDALLRTFEVKNQLCQATEISLGGVYIGELDIVFSEAFASAMNLRGSWRGVTITAEVGVEISNNTFEYVPVPGGTYTIDSAEWTDVGLKVIAFDNMTKFNKAYAGFQTTGEAFDILSLICQECGVAIGMNRADVEAFPNGTETLAIYPTGEIETYRDLLSQLAICICAFATIDRSGRLILRQLPATTDITDEIKAKMRYSTTFCDFSSYYDTVNVVDAESEEVISYHNGNVGGLVLNIGTNVFMQYGTKETVNRIRQAVVDGLENFRATPYSVTILPNPAYDLGDLIEFTGGIGQGSLGCIMSFILKIDSSTLAGYGENPALVDARSKTDKEISGLLQKQAENEVVIHTFENATEYELEDDELVEILRIRFATVNPKVVNIWHEIDLDVETDPLGDGIVTCQAFYYIDDELITYSPVTTWNNDGYHLLHLMYFLQELTGNQIYEWKVKLKISGGTANIAIGDIHASLYGQGLVASDQWDGTIDAEDIITAHFGGSFEVTALTESVTTEEREIEFINASDNVSATFGGSFRVTFSENISVIADKILYIIGSEDENYILGSEDEQYQIESEE